MNEYAGNHEKSIIDSSRQKKKARSTKSMQEGPSPPRSLANSESEGARGSHQWHR